MADNFQEQITDVQDPANVEQNTGKYVEKTSPQSAGYIDAITGQNLLSEIGQMKQQMANLQAPDKLSRSDIFPTQVAPVTQQGVNGQFLNMPTIAPTAPLVPYELIYEQERQKAKAQKEKAAKNAIDLTMTDLWDAGADIDYKNAGLNYYLQNKKNYEEIYGDNAVSYLKNDPAFNTGWKIFNNVGKIMNETAKDAATILSMNKANDPFRSDKTVKAAKDYFTYQGKFIDAANSGDSKEMTKWANEIQNTRRNLLTYRNVNNVLTNETDALVKAVGKSKPVIQQATTVLNSPLSSADQKKYAIQALNANNGFVRPVLSDNNSVIGFEFDRGMAEKHFLNLYNQEYPKAEMQKDGTYAVTDEQLRETAPDPNEFINLGVNKLKVDYDTEFEDVNTYAKDYARLGFDKEKYKAVPYIIPNERGVTKVNGTDTNVENYTSFQSRPIIIGRKGKPIGMITELYDLEVDGKPVKYVNIVRNKIDQEGNILGIETISEPADNYAADITSKNGAHVAGYNDYGFKNLNSQESMPIDVKTTGKVKDRTDYTPPEKPSMTKKKEQTKPKQSGGTTKFTVDGKVYNIPNDQVEEFKKEMGIK